MNKALTKWQTVSVELNGTIIRYPETKRVTVVKTVGSSGGGK
ncbi:MAG TPA: hypothetical protein VKA08_11935 [Balneolales bacterium]|nr:hypothetical protein [Balneolales bacterium]